MSAPLFPLGQFVATPSVLDASVSRSELMANTAATRRATVEVRGSERHQPAAATPSEQRVPNSNSAEKTTATWPKRPNGSPDFGRMNSAERHAYDSARLQRIFG